MWNMTVFDSSKSNLPDGGQAVVCLCRGPEAEGLPRMALKTRMVVSVLSAPFAISAVSSFEQKAAKEAKD
jgi:hypothetical protein